MACPKCGSLETEALTTIDLIDSFPEGDLTVSEFGCLRCGELFTQDRWIERPERKEV